MIGEVWEQMRLNDSGRQKLARQESCQQAQQAQLYILTYYSLRKRERAPDSHKVWGERVGGTLISASTVPHRGRLFARNTKST